MKRGFKTWAENEALEQRRQLGLPPLDPLPGTRLAEKHRLAIVAANTLPGVSVPVLERLTVADPNSWSAFTVWRNDKGLIVLNPTHSQKRTESNVMHELAHRICGHSPSQVVALDGTDLFLREYKKAEEDEAAWLGGCLQLPRSALVQLVRQGLSQRAIGDQYTASDELVAYRVNVTGVLRQLRARIAA